MHQLSWIKCDGNTWCPLLTLNLAHSHFNGLDGIYIIWHGGPAPQTVYVGQGNIKDRLSAHRVDPRILKYSTSGLFTTWADVDTQSQDGVERYLADRLGPLEGAHHPVAPPIAVVTPIPVTLPW